MKLNYKKIELLATTHTQDAEGFLIESLTPIAPPLWAYFRQLSGKEVYATMTVPAVEEVQFVINRRGDSTTAHMDTTRALIMILRG